MQNAIKKGCEICSMKKLRSHQEDAIKYVVAEKRCDVFINLLARFGKSYLYVALLVVFSSVRRSSEKNLVIVIYPLPIFFRLLY